jgi:uncharacterized protein (TIGR02058 family)
MSFPQVLAVQLGYRVDQHGQNPTTAAVKAVTDALDKGSLPAVMHFVPGGFQGTKIKAKIGTPNPVRNLGDLPCKRIPVRLTLAALPR